MSWRPSLLKSDQQALIPAPTSSMWDCFEATVNVPSPLLRYSCELPKSLAMQRSGRPLGFEFPQAQAKLYRLFSTSSPDDSVVSTNLPPPSLWNKQLGGPLRAS